MNVGATNIHNGNGRCIAWICAHITVDVESPAELASIIPYLQHAANCPPDRVRFTPEPMEWEHPTPWVWYSGEYAITLMDGRHYLIFRGECVRSYLSLADAQSAAARHRESN